LVVPPEVGFEASGILRGLDSGQAELLGLFDPAAFLLAWTDPPVHTVTFHRPLTFL
jgi:hypothetical protein